MKTFKNYEEIEKIIEEECHETFENFVCIDLIESIRKKANEILKDSFMEYIIVRHPHQCNPSVIIPSTTSVFNVPDFDGDLEEYNSLLNSIDIEDILTNIYELEALNSYEIYAIKDLKNDFKTKEEAIEYIYHNQGEHKQVSKEQIENELDWLWK